MGGADVLGGLDAELGEVRWRVRREVLPCGECGALQRVARVRPRLGREARRGVGAERVQAEMRGGACVEYMQRIACGRVGAECGDRVAQLRHERVRGARRGRSGGVGGGHAHGVHACATCAVRRAP